MFLVGMFSAGVAKSHDAACLSDKYGQYAAVQEQWQHDLTNLVLSAYPEYAEVANLFMTDQLRMIEMSRIELEFLALYEPEKLNCDAPLNQWLALNASSKEEIAKADNQFADLLQLAKQARERPPHPDGDALRKVMREKLINIPQFKALIEEFNASVARVESIACE